MGSRNAKAHDPVTLEPCADLLRERVRTVFKHVPKALHGDAEAIHQLRVSGRRLRVTLPLLACKPAGRRARRALRSLRDLTRTAGTSRDLDVIAGLFAEGLRELGGATPERKILTRRLTQAPRRSRARMDERLLDHDTAGLRKDLRAFLARGPEDLLAALSMEGASCGSDAKPTISVVSAKDGLFSRSVHATRASAVNSVRSPAIHIEAVVVCDMCQWPRNLGHFVHGARVN